MGNRTKKQKISTTNDDKEIDMEDASNDDEKLFVSTDTKAMFKDMLTIMAMDQADKNKAGIDNRKFDKLTVDEA